MACLAPEDVLACTLIDRLVDEMWFIKRYGRHQTLAIERWYRQSLDFQVQRLKAQNGRKEVLAQNLAEVLSHKPPEVAGLIHLEKKVGNPVEEIDEILQRTPTELEHNRALEKGIFLPGTARSPGDLRNEAVRRELSSFLNITRRAWLSACARRQRISSIRAVRRRETFLVSVIPKARRLSLLRRKLWTTRRSIRRPPTVRRANGLGAQISGQSCKWP